MGDSDGEGDFFDPEEEIGVTGNSKLVLENTVTETGEENELVIFKMRCKLFRWRGGEWKERGVGESKLLRHKESNKIRFLLRQDKTFKPVANFMVSDPLCKLESYQDSDKMFIFMAYDCSDETPAIEKLVIKLGNSDNGAKFKENFNAALEFNRAVKEGKEKEAKWADVIKEDEEKIEKKIEKEEKTEN